MTAVLTPCAAIASVKGIDHKPNDKFDDGKVFNFQYADLKAAIGGLDWGGGELDMKQAWTVNNGKVTLPSCKGDKGATFRVRNTRTKRTGAVVVWHGAVGVRAVACGSRRRSTDASAMLVQTSGGSRPRCCS